MICDREGSIAERVYRLMLLAYAPGFRERYGQEMLQAFCQGQRERYQSGGVKGLLGFWLLILSDWVGSSVLRYFFPAMVGLAFVVCWIFFASVASTKSGHGSSTVAQLVRAEPTNLDAVAVHSEHGRVAKRIARVRANNLQLSVGRQPRESHGPLFILVGPPALAGSAEPDSHLYKLIGEASIN